MSEKLFEPSLKDGDYANAQVYDIGKLFYVAFLGSIFTTVVLGTISARKLKADKWLINLLIGIGAAILLSRIVISGLVIEHYFVIDSKTLRWSARIASVLLFLCYYAALKQKFKQHMLLGGKIQPILKDALHWTIIGLMVEYVLTLAGLEIIKNVL